MKGSIVVLTLLATICAHADVGPRLTDAEFFAMLEPGRPELKQVVQAANAGDYAVARHEFAEYLRGRTKPIYRIDPSVRPKHDSRPAGVDTADADRVINRDLPSVGVYHKFEADIDWSLNPINYKEWPFQLNRHPFWVTLGSAYWATGEEKYAREFVYQMTDWVTRCPVPKKSSGNETAIWRTIEQGIRCSTSWPDSFYMFLSSPSFTDDAMITMVKSFVEHARQLMKYHTGGNWLTMETDGLMHVGVLFPEFRESAEWRKTATERLYAELDKQVYPDGAQVELTTGYQQVSLKNFVKAWDIARLNDVPMPTDYIAKLEKMYDYNLAVAMPDLRTPGLNDGNCVDVRPSLQQAFGFFPERRDFEWLATDRTKGKEPKIKSVALPFAGQLVMRSGWEPNDLYLLMDAGPFGAGHQHEDALSIVIYANGRYHLVDAGNYAYDGSPWRIYVTSTRGHNTIMVDGEEQHRRGQPKRLNVVSKPLPNKWASSDRFDYACGTYDKGYGSTNKVQAMHTRHIFFVKPEYWIITDLLDPDDDKPHKYQSMFHLDADDAKVDDASKSVHTANKSGGNLSIIPLTDHGLSVSVITGQEKPVVQGWVPAGDTKVYKCRPIPTTIFEQTATGPANFAYVFYPTASGTDCPIKSVERIKIETEPGVQAVGLAIGFADGRTDYMVQADRRGKLKWGCFGLFRDFKSRNTGHPETTAAEDFETDALAAYIRTDGGHITSAAVLDGVGLSRGGERITAEIIPVRDLSRTKTVHKF